MIWFILFLAFMAGIVSILIQEDHPDLHKKLVFIYWIGICGVLLYISFIDKDWIQFSLVLLLLCLRLVKLFKS